MYNKKKPFNLRQDIENGIECKTCFHRYAKYKGYVDLGKWSILDYLCPRCNQITQNLWLSRKVTEYFASIKENK